jgi:hypothetical protein
LKSFVVVTRIDPSQRKRLGNKVVMAQIWQPRWREAAWSVR